MISRQDGVISFSQVSIPPAVASQELSLSSSIFIPSVRFVPKKSSMRAITNMKRYQSRSIESLNSVHSGKTRKLSPSIHLSPSSTLPNSSLYNCLYVLRHLSREIDSSRGFGVDGPEEAYSILRRYLHDQRSLRNSQEIKDSREPMTQYYFAILDLEKCFDSVDTARLYDLLVHLLDKTCRSFVSLLQDDPFSVISINTLSTNIT